MAHRSEQRRVTVRSADGTDLSVAITGEGSPLVLVEPAGHHRGFSAFETLLPHLPPGFAVVTYDRRGRGASGDTAPYTVEREVEDLAAVIDAATGPADVYGVSSGALLAIQAAAQGAPVRRLALFEPPFSSDVEAQAAFTARLRDRLREGGHEAGLATFLGSIMPPELLEGMRGSPAWVAMAKIAPTLVYDCMISEATGIDTLAAVDVPTLLLTSQGSAGDLLTMARTVADTIPVARHQTLPGDWHGADQAAVATALTQFLLEDHAARSIDARPPT